MKVGEKPKVNVEAAAIAKMDNIVVLEGGPGKSCIENVVTGKRIVLRESGGRHVFDVGCFEGLGITGRG